MNFASYAHRTGPIFVAARLTILTGSRGAPPLVNLGRWKGKMGMEINQARLSRLALVLTMLRWNEQVELTSPKPKGGRQVHQQLIWNGPFLSRE